MVRPTLLRPRRRRRHPRRFGRRIIISSRIVISRRIAVRRRVRHRRRAFPRARGVQTGARRVHRRLPRRRARSASSRSSASSCSSACSASSCSSAVPSSAVTSARSRAVSSSHASPHISAHVLPPRVRAVSLARRRRRPADDRTPSNRPSATSGGTTHSQNPDRPRPTISSHGASRASSLGPSGSHPPVCLHAAQCFVARVGCRADAPPPPPPRRDGARARIPTPPFASTARERAPSTSAIPGTRGRRTPRRPGFPPRRPGGPRPIESARIGKARRRSWGAIEARRRRAREPREEDERDDTKPRDARRAPPASKMNANGPGFGVGHRRVRAPPLPPRRRRRELRRFLVVPPIDRLFRQFREAVSVRNRLGGGGGGYVFALGARGGGGRMVHVVRVGALGDARVVVAFMPAGAMAIRVYAPPNSRACRRSTPR